MISSCTCLLPVCDQHVRTRLSSNSAFPISPVYTGPPLEVDLNLDLGPPSTGWTEISGVRSRSIVFTSELIPEPDFRTGSRKVVHWGPGYEARALLH